MATRTAAATAAKSVAPTSTSATPATSTTATSTGKSAQQARADAKAQRLAKRGGTTTVAVNTVSDENAQPFGLLPLLRLPNSGKGVWASIRDLTPALLLKQKTSRWGSPTADTLTRVRGRMHTMRGKGKLIFFVLREALWSVQCTVSVSVPGVSADMIKFISSQNRESVVDVVGVVRLTSQPVESVTQQNVELEVHSFYLVTAAQPSPFSVEDASHPEGSVDARGVPYVQVQQDMRLNNRVIDMRVAANNAIFRLQSAVCQLFREFLLKNSFTEIHTPKLLGSASEGGANVFRLDYFGSPACLAQSPQLYKQMALMGDLQRVFEIAPVFRAEDSNTHRHLCEFVGLDLEMCIRDHYHEVLDVLGGLFNYIFSNLNSRWAHEINLVAQQYPAEPLQWIRNGPALRLNYLEGVRMLRESGPQWDMSDTADLTTPHEKQLGRLVKAKYGTDFYILDQYPLAVRPFYTMPNAENPLYSNSYDLFIRGEEIVSGAQRIHDPELLLQRANFWNIDPATIQPYIDAFKYGAYPHGGGGVGCERVVMLFLGLDNIRKTSMFPRDPHRCAP
eukprot:gnl/Spiro4/3980_TR1980_c0_g6_i1.p1 gnl/Spiro4/3980_TR1980_c0_g6~~gnl/Spiro4/3980_TR1980_c0_g6_i1.p1  ORF type:complete len:574 (-),score=144.72 gnl/Spiro4/3980_TR1980_c0_g6_i1:73-1758(-)